MCLRRPKRYLKTNFRGEPDASIIFELTGEQNVVFIESDNVDHNGFAEEGTDETEKSPRLAIPTNIPVNQDYGNHADSTYLVTVRQIRKGIVSLGYGTCVHIGNGVFLTTGHTFRCHWDRKYDEMEIRVYKLGRTLTTKDKLTILFSAAGAGFGYKQASLVAQGLIEGSYVAEVVAFGDDEVEAQGWMSKEHIFEHRDSDIALITTVNSGFIPSIAASPGVYVDTEDCELLAINLPLQKKEKEDLLASLPDGVSEKEITAIVSRLLPWKLSAAKGRTFSGIRLDVLEGLESDVSAPNRIILITNIASLNGSSGGGLYNLKKELVGIHVGGASDRNPKIGRIHTYPALHGVAISFESPSFQRFFTKFGYPLLGDLHKPHWEPFTVEIIASENTTTYGRNDVSDRIEHGSARGVRGANSGAKKHGRSGYVFIEQ
ncbi:hypothetical protein BJ508DRAFT_365425 [Ascobolus immersus RN42]|uniref:Trypsin-like serine protease n=1 Tax=Ascobolus immersus RN42 TaxID=1160509 RepID=A0A3N4HVG5_ASCIM|nr:hypothetical protein BJ508DRAFT_365425 [Ascobolus immersus RN42]